MTSATAVLGMLALLAAAVSPAAAAAQAISPVVVEYEGRARGRLQLANHGLYPMNVVLEPVGFVLDSLGEPTAGRPLVQGSAPGHFARGARR